MNLVSKMVSVLFILPLLAAPVGLSLFSGVETVAGDGYQCEWSKKYNSKTVKALPSKYNKIGLTATQKYQLDEVVDKVFNKDSKLCKKIAALRKIQESDDSSEKEIAAAKAALKKLMDPKWEKVAKLSKKILTKDQFEKLQLLSKTKAKQGATTS